MKHAPASDRARPAGLTLLEVLVSCGILAIGLASVAALLPAAGSRFAQATQADRAGALAASVRADLVNRGLVAADVVGSGPAPNYAFGQVLVALNTISTASTGMASDSARWRTWDSFIAANPSPLIANRLDTAGIARGLRLEDVLNYEDASGMMPRNSFLNAGTGPRAFSSGLFWGATLIPTGGTAVSGAPATLSVAVFSKDGEAREISVRGSNSSPLEIRDVLGRIVGWQRQVSGGNSFNIKQSNRTIFESDPTRRAVMQPCTSVLALTSPPQWVRVTSSWMIRGPIVSGSENVSGRRSFVILDPNPITGTSTQQLRIVGFEGLLRVDHYPVTLD